MTREKLLGYLDDAKNILVQLPDDFSVISVYVSDPGLAGGWTPPVRMQIYDAYEKIPAEAREWGETLVEYEHEETGNMERYFDAGNVRVLTVKTEGKHER